MVFALKLMRLNQIVMCSQFHLTNNWEIIQMKRAERDNMLIFKAKKR